nr:hypothetical protein [Tanacetum cinerariifolium]
MSDSEDSTITYTAVFSPFRGLSDIRSPGVDGPPVMPEDPYTYVVAPFQASSSPNYVSGPEHSPSPVYVPEFVQEPSPSYIDKSDPDEDPEEDPADYPTDEGDEGDDEDDSSDDDEDDDIDIEGDEEEDESSDDDKNDDIDIEGDEEEDDNVFQVMNKARDTVMSDSEDSTITCTAVFSPFRGLSDIGSPGVDGPPVMPEDPYAYVVASFQASSSPNYVSGPEHSPSPVYVPEFVQEPVYLEFIPAEDDILPAEEEPLPTVASPTTESPSYIDEFDPDEDPEEDPLDYPTDEGDEGDDEDDSSDDDELGFQKLHNMFMTKSGIRTCYLGHLDKGSTPAAMDVGYGITDAWDDLAGAIQEIASTTIKGVNQRVTELSTTFDRETSMIYAMPSPSIESNSSDLQRSNSSVSDHEESSKSIISKPVIKFVKVVDCPEVIKNNKTETARKTPVKYAEMYRNTTKSPKVRGNQMNWNNLKNSRLAIDPYLGNNKWPLPSIESNSSDLQRSNSSVSDHEESSKSIISKPVIKFVKVVDCPEVIKNNKTETARKTHVKYAEMYRNTTKSPKVRGNQRNWNNLKNSRLAMLFPPPAQVYSPPKKDMSWTGLPEFADDTITDYSRPLPSIESNSSDLQRSNSFVSDHEESSESIISKPMIKFVKVVDCPGVIKNNKTEPARKTPVKYDEMYRNTTKSPKVRGNQRNWNNLMNQRLANSADCSTRMHSDRGLRSQMVKAKSYPTCQGLMELYPRS